MADKFIQGTEKLIKKLEKMSFESKNQKLIIQRVARKGGNVLKDEVKKQIPSRNTFEHVDFIRRNVKVTTSKSKIRPGVNVFTKGGDVPVGQGKSRRWWKLQSYQNLVFFGNYKTPGRRRKGSPNRGNVKGITGYNPYRLAFLNKGNKALLVMSNNMIKEIQKEYNKLSRRG